MGKCIMYFRLHQYDFYVIYERNFSRSLKTHHEHRVVYKSAGFQSYIVYIYTWKSSKIEKLYLKKIPL